MKKLPNGWIYEKLGNLVIIKTGKLDANASCENGKYPFFTCSMQPLCIDSYSYDCECVLVAGNGDLNVKYYNGKFDAYQRTYIIESKNNTVLDVKYLYYLLEDYVKILRNQSIGGVIKYIKLSNLTDPKIPLPPIDEQKRIVSILEKAEKAMAKRKESITYLDEYLKSAFVDMFGDVVKNTKKFKSKKLGEVIDFITSGSRGWAQFFSNDGYKFITIQNVKNGKLDFSQVKFVLPPNTKEAERTRVKEGDLLISITADLGRTAVVDNITAKEGAYINQHLALVRLKKEVNPYFISALLESDGGKFKVKKFDQVGVKSGLNFDSIKSLDIFTPPIELQNKFADIVEKVEKIKENHQNSLDELENVFKSLMQKAFRGEL